MRIEKWSHRIPYKEKSLNNIFMYENMKDCYMRIISGKLLRTWMWRRELRSIAKLEILRSSNVGSWLLSNSKHSFRCARLFFSNLLCTSRVPEFLLLTLPLLLLVLLLLLLLKRKVNPRILIKSVHRYKSACQAISKGRAYTRTYVLCFEKVVVWNYLLVRLVPPLNSSVGDWLKLLTRR